MHFKKYFFSPSGDSGYDEYEGVEPDADHHEQIPPLLSHRLADIRAHETQTSRAMVQ